MSASNQRYFLYSSRQIKFVHYGVDRCPCLEILANTFLLLTDRAIFMYFLKSMWSIWNWKKNVLHFFRTTWEHSLMSMKVKWHRNRIFLHIWRIFKITIRGVEFQQKKLTDWDQASERPNLLSWNIKSPFLWAPDTT